MIVANEISGATNKATVSVRAIVHASALALVHIFIHVYLRTRARCGQNGGNMSKQKKAQVSNRSFKLGTSRNGKYRYL